MSHIVSTRRNRFYTKIFLFASSITTSFDIWKNLKMFDFDGVTEISNRIELPTNLTTIVLSNDNTNLSCEYSFNGRNLDGELFCDDGPFSQDFTSEGYLYFRLSAGTILSAGETVQVRVWAWRGGTGK